MRNNVCLYEYPLKFKLAWSRATIKQQPLFLLFYRLSAVCQRPAGYHSWMIQTWETALVVYTGTTELTTLRTEAQSVRRWKYVRLVLYVGG